MTENLIYNNGFFVAIFLSAIASGNKAIFPQRVFKANSFRESSPPFLSKTFLLFIQFSHNLPSPPRRRRRKA